MFNAKMRGQNKAAPIADGLVIEHIVITTVDGGKITLRIYIPKRSGVDDASFPVMV